MEDVRIYHTPWGGKAWWAILLLMLMCCGLLWMVADNPDQPLVIWLCIILMAAMVLFFPVIALWERWAKCPPVTVMTDRVVCESPWKRWEYRFEDVKRFELYEMGLGRGAKHEFFINVHFHKRVSDRKMNEASRVGRKVRRFNTRLTGTQENIAASALTMKPQALCDLLNERLDNYKQNYGKI